MEVALTHSRKQQVLNRLLESLDEWVDGTELATEQIGGSEGHRRIRELRGDGYVISKRRHPSSQRQVFQYSLKAAEPVFNKPVVVSSTIGAPPDWKTKWTCETCGSEPFDRPVGNGSYGIARCATCKSRRFFKNTAA